MAQSHHRDDSEVHYDEIIGTSRAVLILVADRLAATTVVIVGELIDHNECGVAIEILSEMLAETNAHVSRDELDLVKELVQLIDLDQVHADR